MIYIFLKQVYKGEQFIAAHKMSLLVADLSEVQKEEQKANDYYRRIGSKLSCKLVHRPQRNRFDKHKPVQLTLF